VLSLQGLSLLVLTRKQNSTKQRPAWPLEKEFNVRNKQGETVMSEKELQVMRVAQELYTQQPDWVTFFREVLGVGGIVREAFPAPDTLAAFEQTAEYNEIQQMVAKLRERGDEVAGSREPTRVITVRLPASLHESLRAEAHERHTSMNKLCITKLLQMVDGQLVPTDSKLPAAVRV
jgi:predicted HicB family RNase H-like nuclease